MRRFVLGVLLLLTLGGGLAAAAIRLSPAITQMYAAAEVEPPTATQMTVCYGFVCRRRFTLVFTSAERTTLIRIMAKGAASPAAERKALQQAFVWFDRRAGRQAGTNKRVASADILMFDSAHNFDCWDTTRNGVSLLLVLQEWGALRHHVVVDPSFRGNLLVGQTPHNTAVYKEKISGQSWVVDMWPTSYGQVPNVMTLAKWLAGK